MKAVVKQNTGAHNGKFFDEMAKLFHRSVPRKFRCDAVLFVTAGLLSLKVPKRHCRGAWFEMVDIQAGRADNLVETRARVTEEPATGTVTAEPNRDSKICSQRAVNSPVRSTASAAR